jgi:predicted lipoprotein with Yx(FWY)xxD motif
MKTLSKMMTASAAVFGTLAFMAMAAPTAAQAGEFCMTDSSGMRGCGFDSLEQCHASAAGKNGSCNRDPFYQNSSDALAQAKQTHSRTLLHTNKHVVAH